jgi:putative chitinase
LPASDPEERCHICLSPATQICDHAGTDSGHIPDKIALFTLKFIGPISIGLFPTAFALEENRMLTLEMLQGLWPDGNQKVPGLVEGIANAAPDVFPRYGLDDDLTIAHAMAQFSVECGAGTGMEENLNYSAEGLLKNFSKHFTAETAAQYAHNKQMIANIAYGGRMGNGPPESNDGWNYRGRGLCQTTGRNNYQALADNYGLDLINDPDLAKDPLMALEVGVAQFCQCGALPPAQADDVREVTLKINGGLNGFPDRQAWLAKWKAALGV